MHCLLEKFKIKTDVNKEQEQYNEIEKEKQEGAQIYKTNYHILNFERDKKCRVFKFILK